MNPTLPLFEAVAAALHWRNGNLGTGVARAYIDAMVNEHMPSGAGFDDGTALDYVRSTPEKLVFQFGFHHMNDNGTYSGWTRHKVWVRPSFLFEGFTLRVDGPNMDGFKGYAEETLCSCLTREVEPISHWLVRTGHFNKEKA